jgi:hypothetical protein
MTQQTPAWAESAVLDGATADARHGFHIRIARYPSAAVAWLRAYVHRPEGSSLFHDDRLPLTGFRGETDVEAADVTYELTGLPSARLRRTGARLAVIGVVGSAKVPARPEDVQAGAGPGGTVTIEASLLPRVQPSSPMRGRSEVFGAVRAVIATPAGAFSLDCLGHWHEQSAPRGEGAAFARPFTHAMLYGEGLALVVTAMEHRVAGFLIQGDRELAVTGAEFGPPGTRRRFRLTLADGSTFTAEAEARYSYTTPIEGRPCPGTLVFARCDLGTLVGQINDWLPA